MKSLALLLAVCASASAQTVWTGIWSNGVSTMAGVRFDSRIEPPDPPLLFTGSSSGRSIYRGTGGYSATHRYFRDDIDYRYVGYDLLVEQDAQPDTFKLTFLDLGIGPLEFAVTPNRNTNLTDWKKLAALPLPAPRTVHAGEKVEVPVWIDPATGQKLIDVIQVQQSPAPQSILSPPRLAPGPPIATLRSLAPARNMPVVPTGEGTAREFRAEDAEMRLAQPRVTVNGTAEGSQLRASGNIAAGTLVWFYLPRRGRFILSLVPRPDLGFTKAGEVRGGAIKFTMEGDEFLVETYQPVAPGNAPYVLYALHDKEFAPTSQNQADRVLFGSVSPAELVALFKK